MGEIDKQTLKTMGLKSDGDGDAVVPPAVCARRVVLKVCRMRSKQPS